jgi:hypothetical protein
MGACGEEKKSNNNNNKKNPLETTDDKEIEKDIKPIEENEKEILKSVPKPKNNYTIKFINEDKTLNLMIQLKEILI